MLGTVKHAQQLDALALNAIDHNERGPADDQLAGAVHPAWPPHIRVPDQLLHLMGYVVALLDGCAEVILGDVVQLPVTVGNSPA
jgi:hypothetical protein